MSNNFSPIYFAGCPEGVNRHACQMIVNAFNNNPDLFPPQQNLGIVVYFNLPSLCPRNTVGFRIFEKNKNNTHQHRRFPSLHLTKDQLQRFLSIRALDWILVSMHEAHEVLQNIQVPATPTSTDSDSSNCASSSSTSSYYQEPLDAYMMNYQLLQSSFDGISLPCEDLMVDALGHTVKNSTIMPKRRKDAATTKAVPSEIGEETYSPYEVLALEQIKDKLIRPVMSEEDQKDASLPINNTNVIDKLLPSSIIQEIFRKKLRKLTNHCIRLYNLGEYMNHFSIISPSSTNDNNDDDDDEKQPDDDGDETYSSVLLCRVTGERLDKRQNFNSQEIAKVFADFAVVCNHPWWQASMKFFHVELMVISDTKCCIAGVVLHPPNLPRLEQNLPASFFNNNTITTSNKNNNEKEDFTFSPIFRTQLKMEKERMQNCQILSKMKYDLMLNKNNDDETSTTNEGESSTSNNNFLSSSDFAAKMPRPGHFRNDIRSIRSERCNMHTGIAELLCEMAKITENDIVLDPMAGAGTVGLESILRGVLHDGDLLDQQNTSTQQNQQHTLPLAVFTGDIEFADAKTQRINCTSKDFVTEAVLAQNQQPNINSSPIRQKLLSFGLQRCGGGCGMNWDATKLPFRSGVIDVIISDLPFGHRCGNKKINEKMYPAFLRECHRVLSSENNNGRAILLTLERGLMNKVLNNLFYPDNENDNHDGEKMIEGKRIAEPKDKETILKRENEQPQQENGDGVAAAVASPSSLQYNNKSNNKNRRPLFILKRPEICIDMGGLYPYCFELIKN